MINKRGQGLSVNAIILIILGITVLVLLIAGFAMGWGKFAPFLSTNNVATIVDSCKISCSTSSQYDYCSLERELKDGEGNKVTATCDVFSSNPSYSKYGVDKCSQVDCLRTSIVYLSLGDAKIKCVKIGESLRYKYIDQLEQVYTCGEIDLATTELNAKDRCSSGGQDINYVEGEKVETYTCSSKDGI